MKILRKTRVIASVIIIVMIATLVSPIGAIESKAAYQLSLSIKSGMATMTINGNEYKLTESLVVSEGGFDSEGTLWLLLMDQSIIWYNYKYQGEKNVELHQLDTGATTLIRNDENRVTGYVKDNENKNILSAEQIKNIISEGTPQGIDIPIKATVTPTPSATTTPGNGYTKYELHMSINNGMVTITITTDESNEYQLTGTSVAKDGGFDSDCTLWLLFKDQSILWYNYEYQGEEKIELHLLDTGATALVRNDEGRVIGYMKDNENKDVLSEEQIKNIISEGTSQGIKIPITAAPAATPTSKPTVTATPTATVALTLKPTATPTPRATSTPIPTVTTKPTARPTVTVTATQTLKPTTTATPTSTSIPRPTVTTKPTVTVVVTPTLKPTATLTPKPTSKPTAIPKATTKPTATLTLKPTATPKAKVTAKPTPKATVYAYRVNTAGTRKELYNSKEKRVDYFKIKNAKLTYHGWTMKNVKKAEFSKKGNPLVITKSGKLIVINHSTMKIKTITKDIKSFCKYSSKGIPTYATKKNGKKVKITKY